MEKNSFALDISKLAGGSGGGGGGDVSSVNGKTGAVVLGKGDVGLGNVNNTSDLAKPISTATQTALDGKITAPSSATAGQFLVYNGSAWVAQTVPNASGVSF